MRMSTAKRKSIVLSNPLKICPPVVFSRRSWNVRKHSSIGMMKQLIITSTIITISHLNFRIERPDGGRSR